VSYANLHRAIRQRAGRPAHERHSCLYWARPAAALSGATRGRSDALGRTATGAAGSQIAGRAIGRINYRALDAEGGSRELQRHPL
jgi:hypothetical protein